jgi:hypothetical protein
VTEGICILPLRYLSFRLLHVNTKRIEAGTSESASGKAVFAERNAI